MRYVMLSYQRPTLCCSLYKLPDAVLREVELFVVPQEYLQYKSQPYASKLKSINCWDPPIDMTSKKRKWFCENIDEPFLMLDDDLHFYVWKDGRYHTALSEPKLFTQRFLQEIPRLLGIHDHVAIANKFMADPYVKENGLYKANGLGACAFGFTPRVAKKFDQNWVVGYVDMSLNLQSSIASKGNSVIYYGLAYSNPDLTGLPATGMNYRSRVVMLDTVFRFTRKFPGLVTGYRMTGKDKTRWLMIKHPSRVLNGVSAKNKEDSRNFLYEELESLGMSSVPRQLVFDDLTPRADIIQEINDSWKKAGYNE